MYKNLKIALDRGKEQGKNVYETSESAYPYMVTNQAWETPGSDAWDLIQQVPGRAKNGLWLNDAMRGIIAGMTERQQYCASFSNYSAVRYELADAPDKDGRACWLGFFAEPGDKDWSLRIRFYANLPYLALKQIDASGFSPSAFAHKVLD